MKLVILIVIFAAWYALEWTVERDYQRHMREFEWRSKYCKNDEERRELYDLIFRDDEKNIKSRSEVAVLFWAVAAWVIFVL